MARWMITAILLAVLVMPVAVAHAASCCVGDCNDDGQVTIDEIIRVVNIVLGTESVDACSSASFCQWCHFGIDLCPVAFQAISNAISGCPQ
jgi:hypothetical protein